MRGRSLNPFRRGRVQRAVPAAAEALRGLGGGEPQQAGDLLQGVGPLVQLAGGSRRPPRAVAGSEPARSPSRCSGARKRAAQRPVQHGRRQPALDGAPVVAVHGPLGLGGPHRAVGHHEHAAGRQGDGRDPQGEEVDLQRLAAAAQQGGGLVHPPALGAHVVLRPRQPLGQPQPGHPAWHPARPPPSPLPRPLAARYSSAERTTRAEEELRPAARGMSPSSRASNPRAADRSRPAPAAGRRPASPASRP